ncbi:MAG: DUF255 domain-containing protein [Saprospiraceae bacterium]
MRLRGLILFIFFAGVSSSVAQNKIKWLSPDQIDSRVKNGDKKFLVYFYIDACKWCKYLDESTLSNANIAKYVNSHFYSIKMDAMDSKKFHINDEMYSTEQVGKYQFNQLALALLNGRMSFPSVVFLDEKFNKIQVFDTYMDIPDFEIVVSYFGSNHYKKTMFRRYAHNFCRESHFNNFVNGN